MTTTSIENVTNIRSGAKRTIKQNLLRFIKLPEIPAVVFFLALFLFLSLASDNFLTSRNLALTARSLAFVGIAGVGALLVFATGNIDISVGAVMGLGGVLAALLTNTGIPDFLILIICICAGLLVGLFNGLLVAKGHLNAFMVTLGTMYSVRGIIYVITNGWPVLAFPKTLIPLGQGSWLGIPISVFLMFAVAVIVYIITKRTKFGWHVFAVGGSEDASRLSGLNVDRIKIWAFVIASGLAALAGVVLCARLGDGEITAGSNYEMDIITGAVLGGASLAGGIGSVWGVLLGCGVMALVRNLLVLFGVSFQWQSIVLGSVMICALLCDAFIHNVSLKRLFTRLFRART